MLKSKKELKLEEYQAQIEKEEMIAQGLIDGDEISEISSDYYKMVKTISPYLTVVGMFETKSDFEYLTYNDINTNIYNWKHYNGTNIAANSHGLLEL